MPFNVNIVIPSYECYQYHQLHQLCQSEIKRHCNDLVFEGDILQCLEKLEQTSLTKSCNDEVNPLWKSNKHLESYQRRRLEDKKR